MFKSNLHTIFDSWCQGSAPNQRICWNICGFWPFLACWNLVHLAHTKNHTRIPYLWMARFIGQIIAKKNRYECLCMCKKAQAIQGGFMTTMCYLPLHFFYLFFFLIFILLRKGHLHFHNHVVFSRLACR